MPASEFHLYLEQGVDFDDDLSLADENGDPFVLTGFTARMKIRQTADSAGVLADWSTANGKLVLDVPSSTLSFNALAADTAALSWDGAAYYDLELVDAALRVVRLLQGNAFLRKEATR